MTNSMFKIMIVEDNDINQMVLKTYLNKKNIAVRIANNGKEAVDMYGKDTFDCILMDIAMPVMDGISATKSIRKIEKRLQKRTPIIAVTASDPKNNKDIFIRAGIDDYIAKPVEEKELQNKITQFSRIKFS